MKDSRWWIKPSRFYPLRVSDCRANAREFMRLENGVKYASIESETVDPKKVTFTFKGWDGYEVVVYRNIFRIIDRW